MSRRRLRVVAVMTHPVQYLSPWFRHIHEHAPSLDFKVVYATEATPQQQGTGFGHSFEWDLPLRDGYDSIVVRPAAPGVSLDSDRFFGLDVSEVTDAVRAMTPDVVLVAGWHSVTQVRTIASMRRANVPLLYRGDTTLDSLNPRWRLLSRARARIMLRQFAGYLAVGTRSREYLRAMGCPEPAIVSSPHAVDNVAFGLRAAAARPRRAAIRAAFGFTDEQRVVLFAGKLMAIKRPEDAIGAAAAMERGAVLYVGDGPGREQIEQLARRRGVSVTFAGFLNQQQMAEAYVAADALMVPGRETWGLVANEALACGLPVVLSTAVGSASDLATADACVAVPHGDLAAFALALSRVIDQRRRGDAAPEQCEAVVRSFSFECATNGLVTAATFAAENRQRNVTRRARVVGLCGNLVFAGGMERITFEGLSAIRRGGADVHVLLNGWSSRPVAELAEQRGITWEVGHYDARLDGIFKHPSRMARALAGVLRASAHLATLLWRRRVTHVFAADFRSILAHLPALLLCRLLGVTVVLRSGVAPTRSRVHSLLWRRLIRPVVSRHLANSRFTATELNAIGIPTARIATIANIAPARKSASLAYPREERRIAYVGQVIPEKGVLQLVEAVGVLVARGYDVTLDIAGQMDGWAPHAVHAYRAALRARASEPDLAGRVSFLGWREDIDAVLMRASLHCCPSQPEQREGFGITVVEAKRAGIPSVVCPSGALAELIEHRRDGWVTRGFDGASIAEGLEWFLSDESRIRVAQQSALASAGRFDPQAFEQRWQEEFGLRPSGHLAHGHCEFAGARSLP